MKKIETLAKVHSQSELVIGLVGAVGTELKKVSEIIEERLKAFQYKCEEIRISHNIIKSLMKVRYNTNDEYQRISKYMDSGNKARKISEDNAILALGAASLINYKRTSKSGYQERKQMPRQAYIIRSLKHPEEVQILRQIYSVGFYLIGVFSDEKRRIEYLTQDHGINRDKAREIIQRDEDENIDYGQRTRDTFHLSDFFVHADGQEEKLKKNIWRILDIIFGHPYKTPTFDEFAMFMAFTATLRSCDLSRQVGAVIGNNNEILTTGANDCPQYGGGLYWPEYNSEKSEIIDVDKGRDYTRSVDCNTLEKKKIVDNITSNLLDKGLCSDPNSIKEVLNRSLIKDITEYGRMVHAEMEALLSCARNHISCRNATLYCTTFPCHNCTKHIIAAGIIRVVYVEPYPKSKSEEFHNDSIQLGFGKSEKKVKFEPFVGVGPRRFFDLFSINLGSGYALVRKDQDGKIIKWDPARAALRIQLIPNSYLERENEATNKYNIRRRLIHEKG